MSSRKLKVFHNVNAGVINRITHLFFQFIIRTVMIRTLGEEYLGLSSLFTSILQVLSVAELGFGNAVVYSMYKPFAEKNYDKLNALLNYYRKVYYLLGSLIFGVGLILVPFLPHLIHGSYPNDINIYVLYIIYLLNTSLGYFLFAYKVSLFIADQKDYIQNNIKTILNIIMYISQIIILFVFKNYYPYVVMLPLATAAINIVQEVVSKRKYPSIRCEGILDDGTKLELKKQVTGLLSYKIGGVVYDNADVVVISAFIGLSQVAIYTNYYYIIMGLNAIFAIVQSAMTSSIGNAVVVDSLEDNVKRFKLLTLIYNWVVGWAMICCVCLFQPTMKIWMGEKNLLPFSNVLFLSIYFYLYNFQPALLVYKNAAGIWWQDKVRPIVSAGINIALNIILVRIWGINGVILASILTAVFINIPFSAFYVFRNYLKIDLKSYIFEKTAYFFATILICAITYGVCVLIPESNDIITFLVRGVVCAILPNIFFGLLYKLTGNSKVIISFLRSFSSMLRRN